MEIIFVDFAYPLFFLGFPLAYVHRDDFKGITLASGAFFGLVWLLFVLLNTDFYLNDRLPLLVEASTSAVVCAGVDIISWILLRALPSSVRWIFYTCIEIISWSIENWEFVACLPCGIFSSLLIFNVGISSIERFKQHLAETFKSAIVWLLQTCSYYKNEIANFFRPTLEPASPIPWHQDWRYEDAEAEPVSPTKSLDTSSSSAEDAMDIDVPSSEEEVEMTEMQQVASSSPAEPETDNGLECAEKEIEIPEMQQMARTPSPPPPPQRQPSPPPQQEAAAPFETPVTAAPPIEGPRRRARFAENPVTRVRLIEPAPYWPRLESPRRRTEEIRPRYETAVAPQEPSQDHAAMITTSIAVEQTAVETPAQDSEESHVPEATINSEAGQSFDNITSAPPPVETAVEYPILSEVSSPVLDTITNNEAGHSFESITEASPPVETAVETPAQDGHINTVPEATAINEAGRSFANLFPAPAAVESAPVPPVLDHMPTPEEGLSRAMDLDETPTDSEPMDEGNDSSNVGSTSVNDAEMEMDATSEETPSEPLPMSPAAPVQQAIAGPDITMAEGAPNSLAPTPQPSRLVQQRALPSFTATLPAPQPSPPVRQPPPAPVRRQVSYLRTTPGPLALPGRIEAVQEPLRREVVTPSVAPRPKTEMSEDDLVRALDKGKKKVNINSGLISVSQQASREADTPMAPPTGRVARRPPPVSLPAPEASSQAAQPGSPARHILTPRAPPRPLWPITAPTPAPFFPTEPPTPGLDPLPELDDEEKMGLEIGLELEWVDGNHGIPNDKELSPDREELFRRKEQLQFLPKGEKKMRLLLEREIGRLERQLGVRKKR